MTIENLSNIEPFENVRGRTDRFTYARAESKGQSVFVKHAPTPGLYENLRSELVWHDFMSSVKEESNGAFISPRITQVIDAHTVVFEFIDAPHLSGFNELEPWTRHMHHYVDMLKVFDDVGRTWIPDASETRSRGTSTIARWEEWLGPNAQRVSRLSEAEQQMIQLEGGVVTQMQHGDLTPWQIFQTSEAWVIYDGEHSGVDHARYTDLAYGYGRLYTLLRAPEAAARLLRLFIGKTNPDMKEFKTQFLPVVLGRSVGMLSDAYNDQAQNDYVAYAEKLLDSCLQLDLEVLTS